MSEVFIVFISKHSQACRAIKQQLDYISPYFNTRLVDIDNINIRKALVNATKYKIESVPSIVLLYPSTGKIEKHEGQQVVTLLNKGVQMVQQKIQMQQQQQRSKAREIDEETQETAHSEIEDILEDENQMDEEDEVEEPQVDRKRKVGKTTMYPSKEFSPLDEEGMIGGMKHLPRREEHTGMAHSSLPEMDERQLTDRNRNYPANVERQTGGRKVNTKIGKKSVMIEDLSEIPDKPQGMSLDDIIGQDRGGSVARSKETDIKSKDMRQRQESLMAEREAMMESENQNLRQRRGM